MKNLEVDQKLCKIQSNHDNIQDIKSRNEVVKCAGIDVFTANMSPILDSLGVEAGSIEDYSFFLTATILPLIYGGVHLSAWNHLFPTSIEHVLWRVSGIGIIAAFPLYILISCFQLVDTGVTVLIRPLILLEFAFYFCRRVFLVVEAFASLRRVPLGVYAAVPWVQSIPHV